VALIVLSHTQARNSTVASDASRSGRSSTTPVASAQIAKARIPTPIRKMAYRGQLEGAHQDGQSAQPSDRGQTPGQSAALPSKPGEQQLTVPGTAEQVGPLFLPVMLAWLAGPSLASVLMTGHVSGRDGYRDLWVT
jgi:hypothetical protein